MTGLTPHVVPEEPRNKRTCPDFVQHVRVDEPRGVVGREIMADQNSLSRKCNRYHSLKVLPSTTAVEE